MQSHNSFIIDQDVSGRASILGVPIYPIGGVKTKLHENVYDLTLEKQKVLSSTGHGGKSRKKDGVVLTSDNILNWKMFTDEGRRESALTKTIWNVLS